MKSRPPFALLSHYLHVLVEVEADDDDIDGIYVCRKDGPACMKHLPAQIKSNSWLVVAAVADMDIGKS